MPSDSFLSASEIIDLGRHFVSLGIEHIRLTGGEPTLRKDLLDIVTGLASIPDLQDLSLTTNGLLLDKLAIPLKESGLQRLNISIDSLQPERFSQMTRGGKLHKVLTGIDAAYAAGFGHTPQTPIKLNAVIIPGRNDDELMDFIEYAHQHPAYIEPRFIEYMPFGNRWHDSSNSASLREKLQLHVPLIPIQSKTQHRGPARQFLVPTHNLTIGFISPISNRFCSTCNRLRLSAQGDLRSCLAKEDHPSLRDALRTNATEKQIQQLIQQIVHGKVEGHQCSVDESTPIPFEGVMTQIGG